MSSQHLRSPLEVFILGLWSLNRRHALGQDAVTSTSGFVRALTQSERVLE